jgi:outer membrane scaffolding protein for murein synthesis (MipA/OmpV family)
MMLAVVLAALLADLTADAPARPIRSERWDVSLGAGVAATPSYAGSSSLRVLPLPLIDVRYGDRFFVSFFGGAGVNVIALPGLHLGVAVAPDFGRSEGSDARLNGWAHIDPAAVGRLFAEMGLGPLLAVCDIRHELGAASGTLVDLGLRSLFPLGRHLLLTGGAMLTWADGRYMREYFGIGQSQLAAARADHVTTAPFAPGAGLRDLTLSLGAIVPLDEHWSMNAFFRGTTLLGDAAGSPVAQQAMQLAMGTGLAYRWR